MPAILNLAIIPLVYFQKYCYHSSSILYCISHHNFELYYKNINHHNNSSTSIFFVKSYLILSYLISSRPSSHLISSQLISSQLLSYLLPNTPSHPTPSHPTPILSMKKRSVPWICSSSEKWITLWPSQEQRPPTKYSPRHFGWFRFCL